MNDADIPVCTRPQPAADFMDRLDDVFKRSIFDKGDCCVSQLTVEQQMACVAVVWRAIMLSRWTAGGVGRS